MLKRKLMPVDNLTACVSPESWAAFVEMRRSMGKSVPFTDYAARLILNKLELADNQGFDAQAILDEAIEKGWRSVFWNDRTPRKKLAPSPVLELLQKPAQTEAPADPARVASIMAQWRGKKQA